MWLTTTAHRGENIINMTKVSHHFSGDEQRRQSKQLEAVGCHGRPDEEAIKNVDGKENCFIVEVELTISDGDHPRYETCTVSFSHLSHSSTVIVIELSQCSCPRRNCQGLHILQTFRYVWSRDVHKFCYCDRAWGYGEECLTYWCQILLTDMSASKPFSTVILEKSPCPCPWTSSPCPCPRTLSLSQYHWI